MRAYVFISLILVFVFASLSGASAEKRPVALLFAVSPGDGAEPSIASEANQAMKMYLRQTGKADVADFDPESVFIRRAVLEHRVKTDDLVAVTTPDARLRMGRLLGADLVISGDISMKDGQLLMSGWFADVRTGKIWRFDAPAVVSQSGDREISASNAVQSAVSSVVYQFVDKALGEVKLDVPVLVPEAAPEGTPADIIESQPVPPAENADAHLGMAEQLLKSGDMANAILEYRKAINADPRNTETRLKLVRLYTGRRLYTQAVDELARAQQIDPTNEAIRRELVNVYEQSGSPELAAQVYVSAADRNPNDLASRLAAGDYYRQKNMPEEAEAQYRLAAQIDPSNADPHERLTMLLVSQSLFHDGRKALEALQKLDPNPKPAVLAGRYTRLMEMADRDLQDLLGQYENGARSFTDRKVTREYYYELVRGIGVRVDSISKFLEALTPPEAVTPIHRHRILGCSLMIQACTHTLRYLETNNASEKDNAAILIAEARKHLTKQAQ